MTRPVNTKLLSTFLDTINLPATDTTTILSALYDSIVNTLISRPHALPSLFEVISVQPSTARSLLKKLYENVMNTLDQLPTRMTSSGKYLARVIHPHIINVDFRKIHLATPLDLGKESTASEKRTLQTVLTELWHFNRLPELNDTVFCLHHEGLLTALPAVCQTDIKHALNALLNIQYHLDDLELFWTTKHEHCDLTNQEYLAQAFALQFQCVCILKTHDTELPLYNITLPCLFLTSSTTLSCRIYRLAFHFERRELNIPMNGAFIYAQRSEDTADGNNYCTLYIPGSTLQSFTSIARLKAYLVTEIKTFPRNETLKACIDINLLQRASAALSHETEEHNITLVPTSFGKDFYLKQIQILTDKHNRDIQHAWSESTNSQKIHKKYHANYIIHNAKLDFTPLVTFENTLKHGGNYIMTLGCESLPLPKPQPMSSTLAPIKIHVLIHQDLASETTTASLYETHFSWLKAEFETVSGREVIITFENNPPPQLTTFDYRSMKATDAARRWGAQVNLHFSESTRHPALDVYILLTHFDFKNGTAGIASFEHRVAIAQVSNIIVAAHEVGHLFNANHAHGDVIYDSCWSNTLMNDRGAIIPPGREAYRFSTRNREHIQLYLSQFD